MAALQWLIAAVTTVFVAVVAFLQWRTAENKTVLDLFDRRYEIYDAVRKAAGQMLTDPQAFTPDDERAFLAARHSAFFFFGDDVDKYLEQMWLDILAVRAADAQLATNLAPKDLTETLDRREKAFDRLSNFYKVGRPLFAKYMRFSQTSQQPWW